MKALVKLDSNPPKPRGRHLQREQRRRRERRAERYTDGFADGFRAGWVAALRHRSSRSSTWT